MTSSEFHIRSHAEIKLALKMLTFGMIPDIILNFNADIILSLGRNNDGIKRDAGLYFYNSIDLLSNFRDWIETIFELYEDVFEKLGIDLKTVEHEGNGKLEFGFAITSGKISFVIQASNRLKISCINHIRDKLECNKITGPKGSGVFNVTFDGVKYYIKGILGGVNVLKEHSKEKFDKIRDRIRHVKDKVIDKVSSKVHSLSDLASKGKGKISGLLHKIGH